MVRLVGGGAYREMQESSFGGLILAAACLNLGGIGACVTMASLSVEQCGTLSGLVAGL